MKPKPKGNSNAPAKAKAATPSPMPGRGGPRPNSGRKPKALTVAKQALLAELAPETGELSIETKQSAADYAFRLFDETMRDQNRAIPIRLDAAREVLNRVWGKPRQAVEVSGTDGGPIPIQIYIPTNGRDAPRPDNPAQLPAPGAVPIDAG